MPDIDKNKFKYYQIEKQFKEGFVERPEIPEYIVKNIKKRLFKISLHILKMIGLTTISKFGLCSIVQQVVEKP